MKLRNIVILLILPLQIFSQEVNSNEINFSTCTNTGSNAVNSDFISAFYFGKHIDTDLKEKTLSSLKKNNTIGYTNSNTLSFKHKSKTEDISYYISASYNSYASINFTQELFELVFIGNNNFENTSKELSPTSFQMQKWTDLQIGVQKKFKNNTEIHISGGPAFGFDFQDVNCKKLELYTANNFDSTALTYSGQYQRSNTFPTIKAYGFSTSIEVKTQIRKINLSAKINNLGCLWYTKNSITSVKDSTLSFSGLGINETNNFSTNINAQTDSIKEIFSLSGDTSNFLTKLPCFIELRLDKDFGDYNIEFGISHINIEGYKPLIQIIASKNFSKKFNLSIPIKYGGFGNFDFGVGINTQIGNKTNVQISIPTILAMSGISHKFNLGLSAAINYKF